MTEFELIAAMTAGVPRTAPDLLLGAGDDCAIFEGPEGREWLITTDALVEGVHFRREWSDLATLGRKALAVNVCDIAAMGGVPRFFLVALGLPAGEAASISAAVNDGMRGMAWEQGMLLIGGDTVASPAGLVISITVIGEAPKGKAILRSGARPGDAIYVTGTFGGSALGLSCLRAQRRGAEAEPFIRRHLDPKPRVSEGKWIAATGMATAMIDVSDGLMADLGHVADASGSGFTIEEARVPRDPALEAIARSLDADPTALALSGGEDYELCFTVGAGRMEAFEAALRKRKGGAPIRRIGTIVEDPTVRAVFDERGEPLRVATMGFDHFA